MSKRRRKNQKNHRSKNEGAAPKPPRPEASHQTHSLRLSLPFSGGGAKLLLQFRKFPKTFGVLVALLVSVALFLSNFVKAMEMVKDGAKLAINLYKSVAGAIKVDEMTSQDRHNQEALHKLIQELRALRKKTEIELNDHLVRKLEYEPGSSEYRAHELLEKNQEHKLRGIDSALTKALKEAKRLEERGDFKALEQREGSTRALDASSRAEPETQKSYGKNQHSGDSTLNCQRARDRKMREPYGAEIKQEDFLIEVEASAPAVRPWPERENLMAGRRDSASLLATISDKYKDRLQSIYRYELRKSPQLKGKIALRIAVNAQGRVQTRPEIVQSTLSSSGFEGKILDSITKWDGFDEVPEAQGDIVFRITFSFGE
jgi:hypothetical protein